MMGGESFLSQILLGMLLSFFAFEHYKGREWIINKALKNKRMPKKRFAYKKTPFMPYAMLGTFFIVMGIVESTNVFSMTEFIILYFELAGIILLYTAFKIRSFYKN
ncbi:MAG: hypothetical protein ACQEQA_04495 [Bacillota bacterium]